jgi:hypothetical protein
MLKTRLITQVNIGLAPSIWPLYHPLGISEHEEILSRLIKEGIYVCKFSKRGLLQENAPPVMNLLATACMSEGVHPIEFLLKYEPIYAEKVQYRNARTMYRCNKPEADSMRMFVGLLYEYWIHLIRREVPNFNPSPYALSISPVRRMLGGTNFPSRNFRHSLLRHRQLMEVDSAYVEEYSLACEASRPYFV